MLHTRRIKEEDKYAKIRHRTTKDGEWDEMTN